MARHDVGEQTDHQRERLGEYPEELHERHDRQGQFQVDRRFGPKDLFPVRFRGEQVDRYKRTAIFPVILAPPGKIGMIPIRLLIKIKKNTVSK